MLFTVLQILAIAALFTLIYLSSVAERRARKIRIAQLREIANWKRAAKRMHQAAADRMAINQKHAEQVKRLKDFNDRNPAYRFRSIEVPYTPKNND